MRNGEDYEDTTVIKLIDVLREFGASENQIPEKLVDKLQITIDEAKNI